MFAVYESGNPSFLIPPFFLSPLFLHTLPPSLSWPPSIYLFLPVCLSHCILLSLPLSLSLSPFLIPFLFFLYFDSLFMQLPYIIGLQYFGPVCQAVSSWDGSSWPATGISDDAIFNGFWWKGVIDKIDDEWETEWDGERETGWEMQYLRETKKTKFDGLMKWAFSMKVHIWIIMMAFVGIVSFYVFRCHVQCDQLAYFKTQTREKIDDKILLEKKTMGWEIEPFLYFLYIVIS